MKRTFLTLALLGALSLPAEVKLPPSCSPTPQGGETNVWWYARRAEKLAEIAEHGSEIQVAFFGDSITHYWEGAGAPVWAKYFAGSPYRAIDLGFGWERTENVIWRMQNGDLEGYSPKAIVIMIGTNNIGGRRGVMEPPGDTVLGIAKVLETAREKQPDARIILCSICPRGASPTDTLRVGIDAVNPELEKLCDGEHIIWCDWGKQMLDAKGNLPSSMCSDYCHPTEKGYGVWAKNLLPLLNLCVNPDGRSACEIPAVRTDKSWWVGIAAKRTQVADQSGLTKQVVFLGDALLQGFYGAGDPARRDALGSRSEFDLTMKGDRVQNVHWRARYGELHAYTAKCVLVCAGSANTNDPPEEVARGIFALANAVHARQNRAKVVVTPVPPRGLKADSPLRSWGEAVNRELAELLTGTTYYTLDPASALLEEDGSMKEGVSQDGLTLTKAGYELWGALLKKWLRDNL